VKVRDAGEGALIRKIRARFPGNITVPIGDDAAVFEFPSGYSAVFCSDLVAENTHFLRNQHPSDSIGYKAVAVNVSDIGAMGGTPMYFLISLALPGDLDFSWVEGFLTGVEHACNDFHVALAGGDSSSAERIFVDVSMVGRVPTGAALLRAGAKVGDSIYVTGNLGSSMLGLENLKSGGLNHPSVKRHLYPEPRHRAGAALAGRAHAAIDVSDGLSTDLHHIVEESEVSARIYMRLLPRAPDALDHHVLHGGEEYELIIIGNELPALVEGVALTRIGEIIASGTDHQVFLIDGSTESVLLPQGWQHF
jgi:thiamine-monophosphate kinase